MSTHRMSETDPNLLALDLALDQETTGSHPNETSFSSIPEPSFENFDSYMSHATLHGAPYPEPDGPVLSKARFSPSTILGTSVTNFRAPKLLTNPLDTTPKKLLKKWGEYATSIRYVETVILSCQGRVMKVVFGAYGSTTKALSLIDDINPEYELTVLECCNNFTTLLYEHFYYYHEKGVEVPEILVRDRLRAFELSENCGNMLQGWFDRGPTFGYPYKGKARKETDHDPTLPGVGGEEAKNTKTAGKAPRKSSPSDVHNTKPTDMRKIYGGKQPRNGYVPTITNDDSSDYESSDDDSSNDNKSDNDADAEDDDFNGLF
jgi:hypothetical protein